MLVSPPIRLIKDTDSAIALLPRVAAVPVLNHTFVVCIFSGGGTRAAAFSYGALEKIKEVHIDEGHTMLDLADVISSVSGGSFTAAYYALHHEKAFQDFPDRFLYANTEIYGQVE